MKTTLLDATTEDKLLLRGVLYEPDQKTDNAIIHVHGMAGNFYENRYLDSMAQIFTTNNWAFLTFNNRGHDFIADFPIAESQDDYKRIGNMYEKFEESVFDVKAWVDLGANRFTTIVLQAHSLGPSKAVYYLTQTNDKRISKLVIMSPGDMVGLFEEEDDHKDLLSLAKKLIAENKGDEVLPKLIWDWYRLSANTYANFSTRDNPIDIFNTYDPEKSSVLSKITIPIFALFGSSDDAAILPIPKALEVIKNKATNCPKFDTAIIEGAPHSYFNHEDELAKKIISWIRS